MLLYWHQWQQQGRSWEGTYRLGISSSHPPAWFISAAVGYELQWPPHRPPFSHLVRSKNPRSGPTLPLEIQSFFDFCHLVASTKPPWLPWLLIFPGTSRGCSFCSTPLTTSACLSETLTNCELSFLRNFDNLKHIQCPAPESPPNHAFCLCHARPLSAAVAFATHWRGRSKLHLSRPRRSMWTLPSALTPLGIETFPGQLWR